MTIHRTHSPRTRLLTTALLLGLSLCLLPGLAFGEADKGRTLPEGFVYVTDVVPEAILEIRYYSTYNFVGARVDAYNAPVAVLSAPAGEALKKAQQALDSQGYVIKVFDAYRPQQAVTHFVRWAENLGDAVTKEYFYPDVDKADLFTQQYIAKRSGHSRGSTVDLTIVEKKSGKEVDMGSPFDFFGEISHPDTDLVTPEQKKNRMILQKAMMDAGYLPIKSEWWHFRLKDEPYPDTYFDFPVDF